MQETIEANNIKVNGNENTILGYHNAVINADSGSITFFYLTGRMECYCVYISTIICTKIK